MEFDTRIKADALVKEDKMKRCIPFLLTILALQTSVALASERATLRVHARDSHGRTFINNTGRARTFRMRAYGGWLCALDGRRAVDADGPSSIVRPGSKNIAPHLPGCSLVMKRGIRPYEMAGTRKRFHLRNGETVRFVMNDQVGKFRDNGGFIEIVIRDE